MTPNDLGDAVPALKALLARDCVTELRISRVQPLLGVCRGGSPVWFAGPTLAAAAVQAVHALSPRAVDPSEAP